MKNLILLTAVAFTMSLTSCVDLPVLNPDASDQVIVTDIHETFTYDMTSSFFRNIDINGNGTSDFNFYGTSYNHPTMGHTELINLDAARPGNQVIRGAVISAEACGTEMQFGPIQSLVPNFLISIGGAWSSFGTLYVQSTPNGGSCSEHRSFIDYGTVQYYGIQFEDEGSTYYGWISIKAENTTDDGLPGCAEQWTILQCAYNSVPGAGARIPS